MKTWRQVEEETFTPEQRAEIKRRADTMLRALSIGAAIRRHRKGMGLTQRQLADRAGMDTAHVGRVERGRMPRDFTLNKLCHALKVVPAQLILGLLEKP